MRVYHGTIESSLKLTPGSRGIAFDMCFTHDLEIAEAYAADKMVRHEQEHIYAFELKLNGQNWFTEDEFVAWYEESKFFSIHDTTRVFEKIDQLAIRAALLKEGIVAVEYTDETPGEQVEHDTVRVFDADVIVLKGCRKWSFN